MHVEKRTGREGEGREKKTGGRTGARHFSAEKCGEGKPVEECGNGRSKSEGRPVEKRGNGRSKSEGQSVEKRGNGRSKSARTDGREARRRAVEERGTGGREARERTIEERGNGRSKSAGTDDRRARERTVKKRGDSEEGRRRRWKYRALRMEVDNLTGPDKSTLDRIPRAARRTVIPRHQNLCMVHKEVVPTGVATPMIGRSQHLRLIGRRQHPFVTDPFLARKIPGLFRKGNRRNQPDLRAACPKRQHGFGGRQIEPDGHAAQKRPEPPGTKLLQRAGQGIARLAPIGAVSGEGDTGPRIENHESKDSPLARTLQDFPLNSKSQRP